MNRELKFRAWTRHGKMIHLCLSDLVERGGTICWPENESCPIMQCAGLKDKNGQEIYEGDLLGSRKYDGTVEVVWHMAGFSIKWTVTKDRPGFSPLTAADIEENELVVAGNIYQRQGAVA